MEKSDRIDELSIKLLALIVDKPISYVAFWLDMFPGLERMESLLNFLAAHRIYPYVPMGEISQKRFDLGTELTYRVILQNRPAYLLVEDKAHPEKCYDTYWDGEFVRDLSPGANKYSSIKNYVIKECIPLQKFKG